MKLVDAEAGKKEAERIQDLWNRAMAGADGKREISRSVKMQELFQAVKYVLGQLPSVDAVPIVRCRDCKFCVESQVLRQQRCYCPKKPRMRWRMTDTAISG